MNKGFKIILSVLAVMVTLIMVTVGSGYYYVNKTLGKMEKIDLNDKELAINEEVDKELSDKYSEVENIALFGIDQLDGKVGRSDAMMIATINKENNKVKITSIMRDSYVNIPGRGKDKINHAYAFGGPELALRTINENFGLNIKNFVTVNFSTLPKIVDMIGGVSIDVDGEEIEHLASLGVGGTGMKDLNGEQALAYSRIRYATGGDYKRTERQREVLERIFASVLKKSPKEYPKILDEMLPLIKTNLKTNNILSISTDIVKAGGALEQERFPKNEYSKGETINGVYYLTFDEEKTKEQMHNWLFR